MGNAGEARGRARVLVVDDDPDVRSLVVDVLIDAGYETLAAGDGEEAIALAGAERPSLIILDVMMPEMDGYTVLTRLRALATTREIPVIVLTGEGAPIYRTLSLGVGAVAHLTKPVGPTQLIDVVQRLLAGTDAT
jgi:CheY-like chemotaxis protein